MEAGNALRECEREAEKAKQDFLIEVAKAKQAHESELDALKAELKHAETSIARLNGQHLEACSGVEVDALRYS